MDDLDRTQLEQVLRLAKENNHMLRSMRRNAWLGGIIKLLIYAGLIVIPFWLYLQYLAPVMGALTQSLDKIQQVQGAGTQVSAQFGELNEAIQGLKTKFPQLFPSE